ncbi:SEN1 N terminal-domain-containing protein [Gigaspora rosea]|uniref:SEN1 N terminal-domain-containing protein n=1 Tax=Gigaspora rosea TaxID=44941 RepID=A0A397UQ98_9GLOM|nr:SEN1 N terminal-domain-containing protein [Gigaspora rosea]
MDSLNGFRSNEETFSDQYNRVIELLQRKKDSPHVKLCTMQFLEEALHYVINCHRENPSRHLFCTSELTVITIEMLPLFAIPNPELMIMQFRQIIEEELRQCFLCVKVFHAEQKQLYQRYVKVYTNEKENADKFFTNLKKWIKSRVRGELEMIKLNLEQVDPLELIRLENFPNSVVTTTAFLEVLLDPMLLISLNNLFVDILLHFKADESFKLTCYYLPGVFVVALHEKAEVRNWARLSLQGMTKPLDMKEFQSCNFTSSIQAILQKLKGLDNPPDKASIQFILTKDLAEAWKGVKLILSVMDQNTILRSFFERDLNIILILCDFLQSFSNIKEPIFIEILGCLEILIDKFGFQFWYNISYPTIPFFQSLFTARSSIRTNSSSSKKLDGIFIKFLLKLRQIIPNRDIKPLEETASEETIMMTILAENQNVIEDIYIECHSSSYLVDNSRLNLQLRGLLWSNVIIDMFEGLILFDEYYAEKNVRLLKCIHKIILMDMIETGRHLDKDLLAFFNDSLTKLQKLMNRFLKKLYEKDSRIIASVLPIHEISPSLVHFLFSTNGSFMIECITLLKKLYPMNTYVEWVQQCTTPIIEGILDILNTFVKWTDIGCDTFKLAGSIQQLLLNVFSPTIFGDKGILKNHSLSQDIVLLIFRYWKGLWHTFTHVFKKYDDLVFATVHREVITQVSSYAEFAIAILKQHSTPVFSTIDPEDLTHPCYQTLKYIIGLLECNNRDLIKRLLQLTCDILYVLTKYKLTIENTLYVKLMRVSNESESYLNGEERNDLHIALSKHVSNEHLIGLMCEDNESSYMDTSSSSNHFTEPIKEYKKSIKLGNEKKKKVYKKVRFA